MPENMPLVQTAMGWVWYAESFSAVRAARPCNRLRSIGIKGGNCAVGVVKPVCAEGGLKTMGLFLPRSCFALNARRFAILGYAARPPISME